MTPEGPSGGSSGEQPSRQVDYSTLLSEVESESGKKLQREKLMKLEEIIRSNSKYEGLRSVQSRGSIELEEGRRLIDEALLDLEYQHLDRVLHAKQKPFHLAYLEDEPVITGPRLEMLLPTANGGFEKIQVPVGIKKSPGADWYIFAEDLPLDLQWPSYENPMDAIEELESLMGFLTSTPRRCPKPEEQAPFYILMEKLQISLMIFMQQNTAYLTLNLKALKLSLPGLKDPLGLKVQVKSLKWVNK